VPIHIARQEDERERDEGGVGESGRGRAGRERETQATQAYLDNFKIIICCIALQLIPTLANTCHFDSTVQLFHY
jgi:hypothetical protein